MAEWISVKDRLPEKVVDVLLCTNTKAIIVGSRSAFTDRIYSDKGGTYNLEEITHWMPLPQPPVEYCHHESCRYYTTNCYSGEGCLATKEIDPCKGNNCKNFKPKEK